MTLIRQFWRTLPPFARTVLYRGITGLWWRARAEIWGLHDRVRNLAWREGYRLRHRRPRSRRALPGTILHVTSSFDVGGTQTQLKHLCTAVSTQLTHHVTEIFPELNYLYRQGMTIDPDRYTKGFPFAGTLGGMVINRNARSSQLVQVYKLYRDFRAERPEVVVGWGHEMSVTTFLAAALARVPHIVFCIRTVNPNYGWTDPPFPRLLQRAHRKMHRRVSAVIANSTLLQRDHAAWARMNPANIEVCPNGIDVPVRSAAESAAARAAVRAHYHIPADAVVIINVGRFSREKGQFSLVEANRLLVNRGAPRRFVWLVCGDGPTLPYVQARAASHGLSNMIFAGRTLAVRDMLDASDIFVMPSDYEGMPNAMMEAMAAGLPCISTNLSGALDVARPEQEALYYDPGDALQLARHLFRWLSDPDEGRRFGEAAARRIAEFSVPRFVAGFEDALQRARRPR